MGFEAKDIDWANVEADYRAGIKSNVAIANEYSVTEGAIRKRAKKESWVKDLKAQIKAKADSLVRAQVVRDSVRSTNAISEKEIIDVNAQMQANIIVAHRQDIQRNRSLAQKLLAEMEALTDNNDLFSELGELLHSSDEKGVDKLNELYHKVISLPSRVDSLKKLSEVLKTIIGLEREAFSIGTSAPDSGISLPSSVDPNESWELIIRNIKQDIHKFTIIQQ